MGERLVQGRPPRRRTGAVVRAHFEAFLPCLAIILPGSSSKRRAKASRNAPSVQGPLSRLTHPSAPRRHRKAPNRPRRTVTATHRQKDWRATLHTGSSDTSNRARYTPVTMSWSRLCEN